MSRAGISLAVVGADYPNRRGPARRFEIALCRPGEPVDLQAETDNPADGRAIAVFSQRGVRIGYVRAERAQWIGTMLRKGRITAAVFQQSEHWGATIRLGLDGHEPVLPERRDPPRIGDGNTEFWPDDIPPD